MKNSSKNYNFVEFFFLGNFNDDDFMNIWSRLENNPKFVQKNYVKAIPLATVLHKSSGITLDLVFKSDFGEEKTRALHQWLGMQYEEGFRFVLFIRKWFDSSSSFDSKYHKMLDMLSAFWLVKEEVLPSFKEIQEFYKSDPRSVMDFATPDYQDYNKLMIDSFTEHVAGFFKYFAEFDWENLIVSPYTGTAIKKTDFFWVEDFQTESNPIAIALTKQKLKSCNPNDCTEHMLAKSNFFCHLTLKPNTDSVYLDIAKPMIVLSFVDANKNYAIHVAKNMVPVFVQFCRKSHELIAAHPSFQ